MEAQDYQTLRALRQKAIDGVRLSEAEIATFERIEAAEEMMNRPAVDFAEVEARMGAGIERNALCARNAKWASHGPKQPAERKPFFADDLPNAPTSIIPCGPAFDGRRGIERMLEKFKAKLAEIRETGRLS